MMRTVTRATLVLLLLSLVTINLVAVNAPGADHVRAGHLSRPVPRPLAILAVRYRVPQVRTTRVSGGLGPTHRPVVPAFELSTSRRSSPRVVTSFPSYWSSVHLTI